MLKATLYELGFNTFLIKSSIKWLRGVFENFIKF